MKNSIKTNLSCPVIAGVEINIDENGLFNLNALHKASGLGEKKKPANWLRLDSTNDLIEELTRCSDMSIAQKSNKLESSTTLVNKIKGGTVQGTFAHELLAVSYAGWISPKFQLMVNQVFLDYRTGKLEPQPKVDDSGLPEYRKARAIKDVYVVAEKLCSHLPNLSEQSKQVIYAKLINPIAGPVIPCPVLESQTYSANEVGERLGITGHKVGSIANKHKLKTNENGIHVLDKAKHSDKQVSNFRYNEKGIQAIKSYLEA